METKHLRIECDPDYVPPKSLGRHVNHDPESRRYDFPRGEVRSGPIFHERHIPIFDQGALGSCTGNAALGILATGPYWDALSDISRTFGPQGLTRRLPWSEAGAVDLYAEFTAADDFPGRYPPTDTGSDGLTAAKVLTAAGVIPGYRHTFSIADALDALHEFPLLVGTEWREGMFRPDRLGRVRPTGAVAGGHEWIVDEFVPTGGVGRVGGVLSKVAPYIGGTTSWGPDWGVAGRFYMTAHDFASLLSHDGDVIVLSLPNSEAPIPSDPPVPAPPEVTLSDRVLAQDMHTWLAAKGL